MNVRLKTHGRALLWTLALLLLIAVIDVISFSEASRLGRGVLIMGLRFGFLGLLMTVYQPVLPANWRVKRWFWILGVVVTLLIHYGLSNDGLVFASLTYLDTLLVCGVEEYLFRHVIYGLYRRIDSEFNAALYSGAIFALAHFGNYEFNITSNSTLYVLYIFAFGMCLTYGYLRTGSLYMPIALHLTANVLAGGGASVQDDAWWLLGMFVSVPALLMLRPNWFFQAQRPVRQLSR